MDVLCGVRMTGPLAPHATGLAGELARLGFTEMSARAQLGLAAHLSRWLDPAGLGMSPEDRDQVCQSRATTPTPGDGSSWSYRRSTSDGRASTAPSPWWPRVKRSQRGREPRPPTASALAPAAAGDGRQLPRADVALHPDPAAGMPGKRAAGTSGGRRRCRVRAAADTHSCVLRLSNLASVRYQSPLNRRTASGSACPARARACRRRRPRRSGPCFACVNSKATSDAKAAMSPLGTIASAYGSTLARTPELFPETGMSRSKSPAAVNVPPEGSARVMTWPRTTGSAHILI